MGGEGGGMGGEGGGQGGEGGEGGMVMMQECTGIDHIDLNADGEQDEGVWKIDVTTSADDNFTGSCQDNMVGPGSDAVIKFVPTEAGLWLFQARDGENPANVFMYAYTDCDDALTEAACQVGGRLALEVREGEPLYFIVDSAAGVDGADGTAPINVTFSAEVAQATAPVLDEVTASYSEVTGLIGLRYSGTDPESDATGFILDLFGEDGASLLQMPAPITLDPENAPDTLVQADGAFQGEIILNTSDFPPIAGVRVTMTDAFGLESNSIDAEAAPPVADLERGDECIPALVFSICGEADACVDADPADEEPAVCTEANPPVVTGGRVLVTAEPSLPIDIGQVGLGAEPWFLTAFGVEVEGSDPENNQAFADIIFVDAEGAEIQTGPEEGEPLRIGLTFQENEDGTFVGRGIASLINPCASRAVEVFNACAEGGGEQEACLGQAETEINNCNEELVPTVAGARVAVGDQTLRVSEFFDVAEVAPTPAAGDGALCGPFEAFGACEEGLLCYGLDPAATTCMAEQTECLEGSPATIEIPAEGDGPWEIMGDHSEAEGPFGAGSCGGGVHQVMYTFTAPAAGTYSFGTSGLGENVDTLIHARSHCNLAGPDYELACNDDREMGNLSSVISFDLEAGATAYVIVDTWVNPDSGQGFPGPFTLTVTAQ
jgi:hypothetical protein